MRKKGANQSPRKKRLTKAQKEEREAFASGEERTRKLIRDKTERAIELRSKERDFHGLEREFLYYQEDMLRLYNRARDSKHPRDVGLAREQIVRKFLVDTGLLPARYEIATTSVRVASTTGHMSNELDVLLYDPIDSITLMRREDAYQVLPVESTYGTIQVKSKATRKDISNGLQNIASYKRLNRISETGQGLQFGKVKSQRGFGLLFAFDTELDWSDLIDEIEAFSRNNPRHLWCNAIFVLSKGFVVHGDAQRITYLNGDIASITDLQMHGRPDRDGTCFYSLYLILLDLLKNTVIQPPPFEKYFRLPFVAGEYSYSYTFGMFAEYGNCEQHGDFARKLTEKNLIEVIEWCKTTEEINWVRAMDIARGEAGDNTEAYARQPGAVRIYNPDSLPLSDILLMDSPVVVDGKEVVTQSIAYDSIETAGMNILIPYYYEIKRGIINSCPKCKPLRSSETATDSTPTMNSE